MKTPSNQKTALLQYIVQRGAHNVERYALCAPRLKLRPSKYILEIGDDDLDDVFFSFRSKEGEVIGFRLITSKINGFSVEVVDSSGLEGGDDGDVVKSVLVGNFDFLGFSVNTLFVDEFGGSGFVSEP